MKKSSNSLGLSTLVMIFTILCLVIFATLSYLQANYNLKQSENIVRSTAQYYQADYDCVLIYNQLKDNLDNSEKLDEIIQQYNIEYNGDTFLYKLNINDNSYLDIELKINNNQLDIIKWQQVSVNDGNYDYQSFID